MEGKAFSDEGKPCQSPGRMKNSSEYIAPVGVRTHDLPHTVASNMGKVSYALTHSATAAVSFSQTKYNFMMTKGGWMERGSERERGVEGGGAGGRDVLIT